MAYMRSLVSRASLVRRRCHPSVGYIIHDQDHKNNAVDGGLSQKGLGNILQQRSFGSSFRNSVTFGLYGKRTCAELFPSSSVRAYHGVESEKIEMISDNAKFLLDTTVQAVVTQAPEVNEVVIAAADSILPVQAIQHFVDLLHSFTGFNWWSSIILATLLMRGMMLPLSIQLRKATIKQKLLKLQLHKIQQDMKAHNSDAAALAECKAQTKKLSKEFVGTFYEIVMSKSIHVSLHAYSILAIYNMVKKVPSFKNGGALWFVDLTTPDSLCIIPILVVWTMWIHLEDNAQPTMNRNNYSSIWGIIFAATTVALSMVVSKGILIYLLTYNMFKLLLNRALKVPAICLILGFPHSSDNKLLKKP